jgi:hypothetical protein
VNANPLPAGTVSVLLGNGGGTYSAATPYPTGSVIPLSVAIGDLNGDGHLDLAVANYNDPLGFGEGISRPQPCTRPERECPALSQSPLATSTGMADWTSS